MKIDKEQLPEPEPEPEQSPIIKSIKTNNIFWISVVFSVMIISYYTTGHSRDSYISGIYTYIFIAFWGYLMHYISHSFNFTEMYRTSTNFILQKLHGIPTINTIIETALLYSIDFHAQTHHDSSINRSPTNVIVEIVQNFLTQGALLVIFNKWFSPAVTFKGTDFRLYLNNSILFLWALFYATVHNINYRIIEPLEHQNHHKDEYTNYGIDIVDIILNTKYNTTHKKHEPITIEDHNHATINIIILTIILIWPYLK